MHTLRRVVLHRLHLGGRCADLTFSPDDGLLAVAVKNGVVLWRAPAQRRRDLAPFARLDGLGVYAKYNLLNVVRGRYLTSLRVGRQLRARVSRGIGRGRTDQALRPRRAQGVDREVLLRGLTIASCARDCVVAFWELDNGVSLASKKFLWEDANDGEQRRYDGRLVDAAASSTLLACAFSTGVFAVYDTSGKHRCACVHRLSVARGSVDAISIDSTGSRIALASQRFGQLVVWDWRAETFVLKQQGHDHAATCCAWSPDGRLCVSGADDRRVKVWSDSSGFCFATFSDHQAPVTAVACARNVVFSPLRGMGPCERTTSEGTASSGSSRRRRLELRPTSRARRSRARPSCR